MRADADVESAAPLTPPRHSPAAPCAVVTAEMIFKDCDLLEHVLSGNVGLETFVAVRQVSRAARAICAESKALVRAVALYSGALNKRQFVGLFSLNYQEGSMYPHTCHGRRHLFDAAAIDKALARPDCMVLMRLNATCSRYEREAYLGKRYGGSPGKRQRVVAG